MISVILFTGGLDSTALAHYSKNVLKYDTFGLTLQQGDLNKREIQASKDVAEFLGINHLIYDVSGFSDLINKQITNSCGYQEGNDNDIANNFIPNRNAYFLLLGHSVCQSIMKRKNDNEGRVMTGLLALDPDYPDSNLKYFNDLSNVLQAGVLSGNIVIETPIFDWTKEKIYQYLIDNNIPIELTWSCNTTNDEPCGVCFGCTQRLKNNIPQK